MDDLRPACAVDLAFGQAGIDVSTGVEPVERPIRTGGPDVVRHGLGEHLEFGLARGDSGFGFGAFDQLARALGDRLHEGDFVGRPVTRLLRIEIDNGAQTFAAQERHNQDGAGIDLGRGFQRLRFGVGKLVGKQVVDHDGFAGAQHGDDLFAEDVGGVVAEQRRHLSVGPADVVAERVLDGIEQAVADARGAEMPAHQLTGRMQGGCGVAAAQQFGDLGHHRLARLVLLARGDIDGGADGAHAYVAGENTLALGGDPTDAAVPLAHRPVFDIVGGAPARVERRGEGDADGLQVVGMQAGIEVVEMAVGFGREAEHRLGAVGPGQGIGDQVEVPGADFGGLGRQAQRLFAERQARFRRPAFGDVADEADKGRLAAFGRFDDRQFDGKFTPRPVQRRHLDALADDAGNAGLGEALHAGIVAGAVHVGDDHLGQRAPHDLGLVPAENLFGDRIPGEDSPARIDADDGVEHRRLEGFEGPVADFLAMGHGCPGWRERSGQYGRARSGWIWEI